MGDKSWAATQKERDEEVRGMDEQDWVERILEFAQTDLGSLPMAQQRMLALRLNTFLWLHGYPWSGTAELLGAPTLEGPMAWGPTKAPLPSVEELYQGQYVIKKMLESFAHGEQHDIHSYDVKISITLRNGVPMLSQDKHEHSDASFPSRLRLSFAKALRQIGYEALQVAQGEPPPVLRRCPAPAPRRQEPCGKWFVGRPNRQYCSPLCKNRAGTRRVRQRQETMS